ncbi:MAG TPA: molybdopterin-binding protein, partial [Dermatophilaceae bacterium]|nr:molybdopterin-binding protein [Dermatophilaceae bacterium]
MRRLVQLLEHRLPVPPATLRRGPFQDGAFTSEARSERTTSLLGLALAVAFGTCFLTGLVSHLIQQPPAWFDWPTRPVGLYRVTQGAHVATGLASIPLLLAKLWSVYPKLFTWPPARDVAEALSRLGLLVLVGSAIF